MKITKEMLEHFHIKSFTCKNQNSDLLCFLERFENKILTFTFPAEINFQKGTELEFSVNCDDDRNSSELDAALLDFGTNWCNVREKTLMLKDPNSGGGTNDVDNFLMFLSNLEQKYQHFGRRKEERIRIGKEKFKEFGLMRLEQTVFIKDAEVAQPCVVLDASIHGIRIITAQTPALNRTDTFGIKLVFSSPEQNVILKAHKVYENITKAENKSFVTLSCQLLEPVHFIWKDKVIKMIEIECASS